jgi:DNA uptake protein ComE-like DNA-binding protein
VGEVYGIKPEFFEMAKPYLELKTQPVLKKINVNTATEQTLANHPYIRYTLAKRIVNYRNEHGSFANFLSLQKIQGVESQTWDKLQPYLEF